jgi:hypothetical protein
LAVCSQQLAICGMQYAVTVGGLVLNNCRAFDRSKSNAFIALL